MKVKYARSDCKCPDMIYAFEEHYGKPFDTTAMRAEAECWERAWQDCLIYQQQLKQYNELLSSMLTASNNIDDDGCQINTTQAYDTSKRINDIFERPQLTHKEQKEALVLYEPLSGTCEPLSTNIFEIGKPLRAGPKLDASAEYVKPYSNNVFNTEFQGNGTITDYCNFMTLDLQHDQHAHAALHAYSVSCSVDDPELSKRLVAKAAEMSTKTL